MDKSKSLEAWEHVKSLFTLQPALCCLSTGAGVASLELFARWRTNYGDDGARRLLEAVSAHRSAARTTTAPTVPAAPIAKMDIGPIIATKGTQLAVKR